MTPDQRINARPPMPVEVRERARRAFYGALRRYMRAVRQTVYPGSQALGMLKMARLDREVELTHRHYDALQHAYTERLKREAGHERRENTRPRAA